MYRWCTIVKNPNSIPIPEWISTAVSSVPVDHLKVFHSARLKWVRDPKKSEADWFIESKNNHYFIQGFANFLKGGGQGKGTLFIVEYGPDVAATKRLCEELGISDSVRWLPVMSRKEIMIFLKLCDVGVGQFYRKPGMIWAGTGWETLAAGRPLLQSFNFTQAEFKEPLDTSLHRSLMCSHPATRKDISWTFIDHRT